MEQLLQIMQQIFSGRVLLFGRVVSQKCRKALQKGLMLAACAAPPQEWQDQLRGQAKAGNVSSTDHPCQKGH